MQYFFQKYIYTQAQGDIKPGKKNIKLIFFLLIYYLLKNKILYTHPKMEAFTKTEKMMINNETFKKTSHEFVDKMMEMSNGDIKFTISMTMIYTRYIHDFLEKNQQFSQEMQELILKKYTPEFFIYKMKRDKVTFKDFINKLKREGITPEFFINMMKSDGVF